MIQLGLTVIDRITRFSGVVTGRATYLTGCDQYLVTPRDPKSDPKWLDEQRLEIDPATEAVTLDNSKGAGADLPAPVK